MLRILAKKYNQALIETEADNAELSTVNSSTKGSFIVTVEVV